MQVAIIVPALPKMVEALGATEQSIGLLLTLLTLPGFLLGSRFGLLLAPCEGEQAHTQHQQKQHDVLHGSVSPMEKEFVRPPQAVPAFGIRYG